jgi:hypothetical protein
MYIGSNWQDNYLLLFLAKFYQVVPTGRGFNPNRTDAGRIVKYVEVRSIPFHGDFMEHGTVPFHAMEFRNFHGTYGKP